MIEEKKPTPEEIVEHLLKQQIEAAWAWLLDDPRGRLVVWSILDKCGMQSFEFYGNSHDTLRKGRQQIGADMLAEHVYPLGMEVYCKMMLEAEARQKQLEAAIEETDAANEENGNE